MFFLISKMNITVPYSKALINIAKLVMFQKVAWRYQC
jgi:hypothetical protein